MPGSRHTRPVSQRPPQTGKNTQGLLASFSFSLLESSVFASRAEGQVRVRLAPWLLEEWGCG